MMDKTKTKRKSLPVIKMSKKRRKGVASKPSSSTSTTTTASISNGSSKSASHSSFMSDCLQPQQVLPSILTKQYSTNTTAVAKCDNGCDQQEDNEYDTENDTSFLQALQEEDMHDILFAMHSLIRHHSAAVYTLNNTLPNSHIDYLPFLLKPMIQHTLTCTKSNTPSTSTSTSTISKNKIKKKIKDTNQKASAFLSTGFNIDLDELEEQNKIKLLYLQLHDYDDDTHTQDDDIAIMFMADYIKGVHDAILSSNTSTNNSDNDSASTSTCFQPELIIHLFLRCIHHQKWNGIYISNHTLQHDLKNAAATHNHNIPSSSTLTPSSSILAPIRVTPSDHQINQWIEYLVELQLLLPRLSNHYAQVAYENNEPTSTSSSSVSTTTSYWLTLPNMGKAASIIMKGRKRIMNKLQRSHYKEIKRCMLESSRVIKHDHRDNNKMNYHEMTGLFHVKDLLVRDAVRVVQRSSGEFITLKKG
mmetsp:Transcript_3209/g.3730  ORF Transcript_3209/g.3730 Transcript_3209/m.3730 type:complete len:473 (-) Transcript_3209:227-1645(-)